MEELRKIKYRSWISSIQEFAYFENGYFDTFNNDGVPVFNWENAEQFIIKNKYDDEIYENDFVKIKADYGGDRYYQDVVAIMKYDETSFYAHNIDDKDGVVWQDFNWENVELLGE